MEVPTPCNSPEVPTPEVKPEAPQEPSEPTLTPPVDYSKAIEELQAANADLQKQINELKKEKKQDERREHQIKTYY